MHKQNLELNRNVEVQQARAYPDIIELHSGAKVRQEIVNLRQFTFGLLVNLLQDGPGYGHNGLGISHADELLIDFLQPAAVIFSFGAQS